MKHELIKKKDYYWQFVNNCKQIMLTNSLHHALSLDFLAIKVQKIDQLKWYLYENSWLIFVQLNWIIELIKNVEEMDGWLFDWVSW